MKLIVMRRLDRMGLTLALGIAHKQSSHIVETSRRERLEARGQETARSSRIGSATDISSPRRENTNNVRISLPEQV